MTYKFKPLEQKLSEKQYLTRTQALAKLQLCPKDFRTLCILKGIFPRDPKKKGNNQKVYYHSKDVKHLLHEPILRTIRARAAWRKRYRKAIYRKESKLRLSLVKNAEPRMSLFHLVKERYPTLLDCVRDLDDCLSSVALFATLPADANENVSPDVIATSTRLLDEFMLWAASKRLLRKVFCSIKGFYMQFQYLGQSILLLLPHQFPQTLPPEVDYSVMTTYMDIYHTILSCFNLKAYKEEGLSYPPKLNEEMFRRGFRFLSFSTEHLHNEGHADKAPLEPQSTLFAGKTFFVSRECPTLPLVFMLMACGAKAVGWQGLEDDFSPIREDDQEITHHILDRPIMPELDEKYGTLREFLQPQWIFDSINAGKCLPPSEYKPGVPPPPHLSPFVESNQPQSAFELGPPIQDDDDDIEDEEFEAKEQSDAYKAALAAERGNKIATEQEISEKRKLRGKKKAAAELARREAALTGKRRQKYERAKRSKK